MERCPTQAVLPLVGLTAEKVIRDRYNHFGWLKCYNNRPVLQSFCPPIFLSSNLSVLQSSCLHIFLSSHLPVFTSSCLHIFLSSNLPVFKASCRSLACKV
ncbi:MAG: hypothetical protein ACQESR_05080 [Planctomycetota bacterium]